MVPKGRFDAPAQHMAQMCQNTATSAVLPNFQPQIALVKL